MAMNMNREQKRMLKRAGYLGEDGEPTSKPRSAPAQVSPGRERTSPRQFFREMRGELRKVAWPTRKEVVNSTIVVLIAVVVMTSLIFLFDLASSNFVLWLFD